MRKEQDNSPAMLYIRSLRDGLKRRFAAEYLEWIRAGRKSNMPSRGVLAPALAKAVATNLDALS